MPYPQSHRWQRSLPYPASARQTCRSPPWQGLPTSTSPVVAIKQTGKCCQPPCARGCGWRACCALSAALCGRTLVVGFTSVPVLKPWWPSSWFSRKLFPPWNGPTTPTTWMWAVAGRPRRNAMPSGTTSRPSPSARGRTSWIDCSRKLLATFVLSASSAATTAADADGLTMKLATPPPPVWGTATAVLDPAAVGSAPPACTASHRRAAATSSIHARGARKARLAMESSGPGLLVNAVDAVGVSASQACPKLFN